MDGIHLSELKIHSSAHLILGLFHAKLILTWFIAHFPKLSLLCYLSFTRTNEGVELHGEKDVK